MVGRLARRSGTGICLIMDVLDYVPDYVVQVGVGMKHAEIEVMREEWPKALFLGCEPFTPTYRAICMDYPGELFHSAIGAKPDEEVTLHYAPKHADGASVHGPIEGKTYKEDLQILENIPSTTTDILFKVPEGRSVLLWLDCEGSELDALEGGELLLHQTMVVNVEMTSQPSRSRWPSPVAVHDFLEERGFLAQWVHTGRSCAGQADLVYVRAEIFKPEFCCIPQSVIKYLNEYCLE